MSDAALVQLDGNVASDLGALAKPLGGINTGTQIGSTTFEDSDPLRLYSDGSYCYPNQCYLGIYPGDYGSKIGVTTGWTGGAYEAEHDFWQGSDGLMRIIVHAFYGLDDLGDSGGPALNADNYLFGLAFGKVVLNGSNAFLVSSLTEIGQDLTTSAWNLHWTPPYMLGYEQFSLIPPCTPYEPYPDPDNFNMYLVYGYLTETAGIYEKRSSTFMGYTGYRCGGTTYYGTYQNNSTHQLCNTYFDAECPCAAHVAGGGTCPVDP